MLFFKKRLKKCKVGNHIMFLDREDKGISTTLMTLKKGTDREPAFMKVLRQEVNEGMIALDIGANIGYVTLILADLVGTQGHVYAIEPGPHNFEVLNKNVIVNNYQDRVETFHRGVSDENKQSKFFISEQSNLHSMQKTKHTTSSVNIDLVKIDDFMKEKHSPNFIKMDIEGHEVEALNGMVEMLRNAPPPVKILIEVHPMYYSSEHSLEDSLRKLFDVGFNSKYVISAGTGRPDFFVNHGYEPDEIIETGNFARGIYSKISNEHLIISACRDHEQYLEKQDIHTTKIVRAIMIEKS